MCIAQNIPEILFPGIDISESRRKKMVREGSIRKITSMVYTPNMQDALEDIVRRNVFQILGTLFPHAVISHRSAFELKPTEGGDFFLTFNYTKIVRLPGLKVHLIEGCGRCERDLPFIGNLYISCAERRILENLQTNRRRNGVSKCLPQQDIKDYLERVLQVNGEKGLEEFTEKARVCAETLGMEEEFMTLDAVVGKLLPQRSDKVTKFSATAARSDCGPFDTGRVRLFASLFEALNGKVFRVFEEPNVETAAFMNFAFFDSYFSNCTLKSGIGVDDARRIIDTGQPLPARYAESHDILDTYRIVASRMEMRRVPSSPDELIDILQGRHRVMMAARPDKNPGMFKMQNNHAGDTHFVDFTLIRGTLNKGFDYYQALEDAFAKAVFMLFMVTEVHPFADGNDRLARIMMNAELVSDEQARIIVPTVLREDFHNALRRLSHRGDPNVLLRVVSRMRYFSSTIQGDYFVGVRDYLQRCGAFEDADGHILKF